MPLINENSDQLKHSQLLFKLDKFNPVILRAEGFVNGHKVVLNVLKTPEISSKIVLAYDISSKPINPDALDMVIVYTKITNAKGTIIPTVTNEVTFSLVQGNTQLIGANPVKAKWELRRLFLKRLISESQ